MTIQSALLWAYQNLYRKSTTPRLDAEVLLSSLLSKSRGYLFAHPERRLSFSQQKIFKKNIARRRKGWPISYLTNSKEFFGLSFYVDRRVLIPRPETELLVEEAINYLKCHQNLITVADVGTGSGCIAITLARFLPDRKIIATDVSKDALLVARKNAQKLGVARRISFISGNLLSPLAGKKIDCIVANLPYLTANETRKKELRFEPQTALKGGINIFQSLLYKAQKFQPQVILLEIDPRLKTRLTSLANELFPDYQNIVKKDLAGRERIFIISKMSAN